MNAKQCIHCGALKPSRLTGKFLLRLCIGSFLLGSMPFIAIFINPQSPQSQPVVHLSQAEEAKKEIDDKNSQKRFVACELEFERYHKARIIYDIKLDLPPAIYAGPMFIMLPIHNKEVVTQITNCVLTQGKKEYVDFDILHWQTGKSIGHFKYGQLEMN